ncbi:MAG: hypothetical protein PHS52_07140, partial [Desulfotomaculaceae bacterium]|nr:hypothetical protein [Desulfotomaculaceae bacterium]
ARGKKDGDAVIGLVLEMRNMDQLTSIMGKIRRVKDVYDVRRVSSATGL